MSPNKEQRDKEIRFNKHCGIRLRNLRCKNGYTQTDLANVLVILSNKFRSMRKDTMECQDLL